MTHGRRAPGHPAWRDFAQVWAAKLEGPDISVRQLLMLYATVVLAILLAFALFFASLAWLFS